VSAAQLLPAVRDLYSRLPEMYNLEPWELQDVLVSLDCVEAQADEGELAAAVEALGCRVERLPEFGKRRFVFPALEDAA
jgi:hypothetical protein